MELTFVLNGDAVAVDALGDALLIDVIRGHGLTGTKEGCGVGVCGACTVLVGELPVSSCCYLAHSAQGEAVWTIEGLAQRDPDLVEDFVTYEAMQCGICTPGQVVSAYTLKRDHPSAGAAQIREYMAGNLCRCTGYVTITEAVTAYLGRG